MKAMSRRGTVFVVAAAAMVVGIATLLVGLNHRAAPPPVHIAGTIAPSGAPSHALPSTKPSSGQVLGPSMPSRLRIPSLGIDTPVNPIGLNPDGTLAVPQPGPYLNQAAWYRNSPTPGQLGVSIIEGHVDSVDGRSVFWRLGEIRPGAQIIVERQDGSRLEFTVDAVRDYPKDQFPTMSVYGGDLSVPSLRLITCSDFVEAIHHHVGDEVVYTHLSRVLAP